MSKMWCLVGAVSGDVLTYRGFLLVHDNKRELEHLFPGNKVVAKPEWFGDDLTMSIKNHPDMDAVVFPLELHMDQFQVPRRK